MGYYTDAVNNLTGAGNALGSAISTAAIAGTHLKQQAQANEQNFNVKKAEIENQLDDNLTESAKVTKELEEANLKKTGLETLGKDYDKKIGQMEDMHMTDESLIRDWEENYNAISDVKKKIDALTLTQGQIQSQHLKLMRVNEALDKANPKLAKKYKEIK